ncbi:Rhamnan synthesis F family protein (fragment) [Legionella fallonii LLAP-10]|uniref:Rhamnan synthesis F family protein n=1 Tax=Legionella fallonii LLAP-10 TaxID=1212491 RepID=A0A098GAH4_9GAMM
MSLPSLECGIENMEMNALIQKVLGRIKRIFNKKNDVQQQLLALEQSYLFTKGNDIRNYNPESAVVMPMFVNLREQETEDSPLDLETKYGFAWLDATRMALNQASLAEAAACPVNEDRFAIVIHAFYEDILLEIIQFLRRIDNVTFKLYVSSPNERVVRSILEESGFDFYLEKTNNHGRDVLPFLQIMKRVKLDGYGLIIKVHTKKSLHRSDGHRWRQDLYNKLLKKTAVEEGLKLFQADSKLGLLVPENHLLPVTLHLGNNMHHLLSLSHRLGVSARELLELKFAAGTMFMARVSALEPLLSLNLNADDFEAEAGQVDGTLAHAIERAIAVSVYSIGLRVKNISDKQFVNSDS